jgi:hypothetical protein
MCQSSAHRRAIAATRGVGGGAVGRIVDAHQGSRDNAERRRRRSVLINRRTSASTLDETERQRVRFPLTGSMYSTSNGIRCRSFPRIEVSTRTYRRPSGVFCRFTSKRAPGPGVARQRGPPVLPSGGRGAAGAAAHRSRCTMKREGPGLPRRQPRPPWRKTMVNAHHTSSQCYRSAALIRPRQGLRT